MPAKGSWALELFFPALGLPGPRCSKPMLGWEQSGLPRGPGAACVPVSIGKPPVKNMIDINALGIARYPADARAAGGTGIRSSGCAGA